MVAAGDALVTSSHVQWCRAMSSLAATPERHEDGPRRARVTCGTMFPWNSTMSPAASNLIPCHGS